MTTSENMREVIGGIASLITSEMRDAMPVPLGDSSYAIVQMGYLDGDPEIWLRTSADDVWILRVAALGLNMSYSGRDDERNVIDSYRRFIALLGESKRFVKGAESCDVPGDMALQAWVDEVLSDDERECWFRWSPGGYATKQEWKIVQGEG